MNKHLYFLGIGGTLMGSLAILAKEMGYRVTGSDKAIYPPMSDQLAGAEIEVFEGFDVQQLDPAPDMIVVGNAGLPRGNPAIEYILREGLPFTSGAQWLGEWVLQDRWVLAVSGTHGKTTTASMLAWILEYAGMQPGYLIGGAPGNFAQSARLGNTPFFVIEADEYDTSYFDRRAKFVHYRPRTLVLNNLEYDHADIFDDLAAIQAQFHLLMRILPENGLVIAPTDSDAINQVLQLGCWTPVSRVKNGTQKRALELDNGEIWSYQQNKSASDEFEIYLNDNALGLIKWRLHGEHNKMNALNAIAAARHVGVTPEVSISALAEFKGVKRRLEVIYEDASTVVYDDFAHHPTAIRTTLQGLRRRYGSDEIDAVKEPRTHTMSLGALRGDLATCCAPADQVIWFRGENIRWDLTDVTNKCVVPARIADKIDTLAETLAKETPKPGQRKRHIVIMSNGAFGNIYKILPAALQVAQAKSTR